MRKKEIIYREDSPFFENLGKYREGISNSLSNFKLVNVIENFKYVLGYYYTYSNLIDEEFLIEFKPIISGLQREILNKETISLMFKLSKGQSISTDEQLRVKMISKDLKKALQLFYYTINVLLRKKNIFPNAVQRTNIDTVRNI